MRGVITAALNLLLATALEHETDTRDTRTLVYTCAVIGENIHEKFTWQKAFSPISQDLVSQGPELSEEQRMRKPNPRRGRAVGYWNQKFLNLNLRSPNYTACGNIE